MPGCHKDWTFYIFPYWCQITKKCSSYLWSQSRKNGISRSLIFKYSLEFIQAPPEEINLESRFEIPAVENLLFSLRMDHLGSGIRLQRDIFGAALIGIHDSDSWLVHERRMVGKLRIRIVIRIPISPSER